MNDLIARLEAATGPDRELDAMILALDNGWTVLEIGSDLHTAFIRFARPDGSEFMARCHDGAYTHLKYTKSVDIAASLVPHGMWWNAQTFHDDTGNLFGSAACGERDEDGALCDGATPAIALCIAALKARAQQRSPRIAGQQGGQT
jgi:hypothetical protein